MFGRRVALTGAASAAVLTACARTGPVTPGQSAATPPVTGPAGGGSGSALPTGAASGSATPGTSSDPSPSPSRSCQAEAAAMPLRARVGQLFMLGVVPGTSPATVAASGVGSIVLLGNWTEGRTATASQVEAMTRAAPGLLVATDQEGGAVQRVKGTGFDTIPNAPAQAAMGDAALETAAGKWGVQLWAAGIRFDLAPVADVVPEAKVTTNQPVGVLKRGYGSDPAVVSARVTAFVAGMGGSGLATSLKHFPGLGEVTGNTDFAVATDTVTTRTSASLEPFKAGIRAGASSVMVSSAMYSKIDPGVPAVFSKVIVTDMLRGDLGFTGVVISDDLGAAKSVSGVGPGERAVRFFAAGGDLLINADPAIQQAMTDAVVKKAESDPTFAAQVTEAAGRVLALKSSVMIGECG